MTERNSCEKAEAKTMLPTVTSNMWHPVPEIRARWLKQYGKERFTFEEALAAQTFPEFWAFPPQKSVKWKWLAEAFPPKVAEYFFEKHVSNGEFVLLDLFAGIGGWSLGAVRSGKVSRIIMVENDKEKCLYLEKNFSRFGIPYKVICDDVRNVDFSSIRADIITASPPCEDVSVLRHFRENNTQRGTIPLTMFTASVVNTINPKIAFYENVYRKPLAEIMKKHGWFSVRFDMSKLIPQKRVRLIAWRYKAL